MNVDKRQAGARSPVSEQTVLDVLRLERLLQQRIVLQIDHAQAQVIAGPPVGVSLLQLVRSKRRSLDSGPRLAISAQQVDRYFFGLCHTVLFRYSMRDRRAGLA